MSNLKFDFILNEKNYLPYSYNETNIVIMPKDPGTIFMYWDISENNISQLQQRNINTNFRIRIRNLDKDEVHYVIPDYNSKDWYFNLKYTNLDKKNLIADLGVYDNDNNFLILASSNMINLPSSSVYKKDYDYWRKIFHKNKDHNELESMFLTSNSSMEFFENK
jgi:hypothetical protein